jgi:TRAP transporter TAXI family solute receptor
LNGKRASWPWKAVCPIASSITQLGSPTADSAQSLFGRRAALRCLGGLAASLISRGRAEAVETSYFKIASGPIQSRYFRAGTAIAGAVSAPPGLRGCERDRVCGVPGLIGVATSTGGPLDNLRLIASRRVEGGLSQGSLIAMTHPESGPVGPLGGGSSIRVIAPLYQDFAHLVVLADSPIRGVVDLRGRRVSLGDDSCGGPFVGQQVLAATRLSERQLRISHLALALAAERLVAQEIDAFFCIEGLPSPVIHELASNVDIRLVPIEADSRLLAKLPLSAEATIPAETYRGVGPTSTASMPAFLAGHSGLEPDLVYALVQAIWRPENRALRDTIAFGHSPDASRPATTFDLPLHPGAERFYRAFVTPS